MAETSGLTSSEFASVLATSGTTEALKVKALATVGNFHFL